jgi:type I restriction enzyme S subunit
MKRYEKYKPSGVEWIGEIPEHWDLERLKYEVHYEKGKNPKELTFNERGKVYLTMDYLRGNPKQTFYVEDFKNYLNVEENQILILWDGSNAGEFIRSKAGVLSSTMAALNLYNNNHGYAWYFFKTFERKLKETTIGMGVPHVNGEEFKNHIFIIPLREEQTAIANYLDEKTAQIDTLVANKQKLIELLKEERTAIINQAVTKGINPKAKLKPSGIEWLGDIPEHWEVKKLKYVAEKVGSGVTPTGGASVYQEEGIPLLRSQNIYSDRLVLDDVAYISDKIDEEMSNSRIQEGDVLLNITGASIGRCHYVPIGFGKGNVNQHVCIIRPTQSVVKTEWLHFIIISGYGQTLIDVCQTGANREGLNFQQIKSFDIPLPKTDEQEVIIQHIATHTARIDAAISKIEKEIELMLEYRTALVSEVVTGKIKVSNFD